MHRIDTPTAQVDKFGAGKNGFTRGNPQTGVPATALDDDYFDAVQEEIAGVVEAAGLTLKKTDRAQVLAAIKLLIGSETNTKYLKVASNLAEIKAAGAAAVTATLANLGLGEGTKTANGHLWLPGGWLLQWGESTASALGGSTGTMANFPIAFPNACFRMCGADVGNGANPFGFNPISTTQFRHWGKDSAGSYVDTTTQYFAIGY